MDIKAWLQENDPKTLKDYERSFLNFSDLKVGQKVITLERGFGTNHAGVFLEIATIEVDSLERKFLTLKKISNGRNADVVDDGTRFMVYEKATAPDRRDWYFSISPVSQTLFLEFKKLKTRDIYSWQMNNFGFIWNY